eukprot:scaffold347_cov380-Prasinococcus_capsulatus_cf.AAC.40
MQALPVAPGPRLQRRARPHRQALLHERRRAPLCAGAVRRAAGARGCVARPCQPPQRAAPKENTAAPSPG